MVEVEILPPFKARFHEGSTKWNRRSPGLVVLRWSFIQPQKSSNSMGNYLKYFSSSLKKNRSVVRYEVHTKHEPNYSDTTLETESASSTSTSTVPSMEEDEGKKHFFSMMRELENVKISKDLPLKHPTSANANKRKTSPTYMEVGQGSSAEEWRSIKSPRTANDYQSKNLSNNLSNNYEENTNADHDSGSNESAAHFDLFHLQEQAEVSAMNDFLDNFAPK
jgi:hypothetical protein